MWVSVFRFVLLCLVAAFNCWGQSNAPTTASAPAPAISIAADQKRVQTTPSDGNAWETLGSDYLQAARYQDAAGAYQKALENGFPANVGKYNLACAYARLGEKQKALDLLQSIATGGFPSPIANDPDLQSLAGERQFQELAKAAQRAAEPCLDNAKNADYRQLDFWVGEWDVFSGKQKVGESSVRLILKDCVVFENWHGLQGGDGKSFNKYNAVTRQWEQFWVSDSGTTNFFKGGLVDGDMRYVFETPTPAGKTLVRHLTFSKLPDGSVRQLSQASIDAGKTWTTEYDFVYRKRL
jgi:tetratricopeptide (TPR) repeat protein